MNNLIDSKKNIISFTLLMGIQLCLTGCDDDKPPAPEADAAIDASVPCPTAPAVAADVDIPLTPCQLELGATYDCEPDSETCQPAPRIECDSDGNRDHAKCQESLPANFFCSPEFICTPVGEMFGEDNCTPGPAGDDICAARKGPGAKCEETDIRGVCGERACPNCAVFTTREKPSDHACCQEALGENWYCQGVEMDDGEGGIVISELGQCAEGKMDCIETDEQSEECCIPVSDDSSGHPVCTARYGASSSCTFAGKKEGKCTRPVMGCDSQGPGFCEMQDPDRRCSNGNVCLSLVCEGKGDAYCQSEFGATGQEWKCIEGNESASRCEEQTR